MMKMACSRKCFNLDKTSKDISVTDQKCSYSDPTFYFDSNPNPGTNLAKFECLEIRVKQTKTSNLNINVFSTLSVTPGDSFF